MQLFFLGLSRIFDILERKLVDVSLLQRQFWPEIVEDRFVTKNWAEVPLPCNKFKF